MTKPETEKLPELPKAVDVAGTYIDSRQVEGYGLHCYDAGYIAGRREAIRAQGGGGEYKFGLVPPLYTTPAPAPDERYEELLTELAEVSQALHVAEQKLKADPAPELDRYRWLCENKAVLLITGIFGNCCVNKTMDDVESHIDAAIAHARSAGGEDA